MHLSRGVLIALALGASNAAARPQWSFDFGGRYTPEEHSTSHSSPEPATSAVQAAENSGSWAGNLFRGWYGGSKQGTSSQSDTPKASVTSNPPKLHTSGPHVHDPAGVSHGPKSEFASQTTVAEAVSNTGHIYSDRSALNKETKPTSRPPDDQSGKSQYNDAGKQVQSKKPASSIPEASMSQSNGKPAVSKSVAKVSSFSKGLETTPRDHGPQAHSSQVPSNGRHVVDARPWKQQNPTITPKDGNNAFETGGTHVRGSSRPESPVGSHQSASPKSRDGDLPRSSTGKAPQYSHAASSSKTAEETAMSSEPRREPTKVSSKDLKPIKTVVLEASSSKSGGNVFPTSSGRAPKISGIGYPSGQPESSTKKSNGWLDGLISRLHAGPSAVPQKPPVSVEGPVKSHDDGPRSEKFASTSTPAADDNRPARPSKAGHLNAAPSISRSDTNPFSLPTHAVAPSVESYLRNLPKGVSSKSVEEVLGGAPGLTVPGDVLDYLRKLPTEYRTVPLGSVYSHRPTVAHSIPVTVRPNWVSKNAAIPTNFQSYIDNLPSGERSLPVKSILGNQQLPGEIKSFLNDLPPAFATVPVESVVSGIPGSVPKKTYAASIPTVIKSFVDGLPSETAALPVESILSKYPKQWPSGLKSFLGELPPVFANVPIRSALNGNPKPTVSFQGASGVLLPSELSSFLKGLPAEASGLPAESLLSKYPNQLPSNIKSLLNGLPTHIATVAVESLLRGVQKPTPSLPKITFPASVPGQLNSALHNLPADATTLPINSILSKYPDQLPADVKSFFNGLQSEAAKLPFVSFQNEFPRSTPGSDAHAPSLHEPVAAQPTQPMPLEPVLQSALEHSKLPKPTGLQASVIPFPESLEPLQSAFKSYLSGGGINLPTGSAESAINHYLGPERTHGAHLPSPSNAVESVIASLWGALGSSSQTSNHNSEGSRVTLVLSSLHFGPGPVAVSTKSGEKVSPASPSTAAGNVLSSLGLKSSEKATHTPTTTSGLTLSTIPGFLSRTSMPESLVNEVPVQSRSSSKDSRPLEGSSSAWNMPQGPSFVPFPSPPMRPQSLSSHVLSLKSESILTNTPLSNLNSIPSATKSLALEKPIASTNREPFDPFKPLSTTASFIPETNPHSTKPANPSHPETSIRSSAEEVSRSIQSAVTNLSRPSAHSQFSGSIPAQKTETSTPRAQQTVAVKKSSLESGNPDMATRTHGQEPGIPTILATLPYFSKLSTLLGVSAASSILVQTTHVIPTDAPELSSFLGHLSSQGSLSAKSIPAIPSLPGLSRLSSGDFGSSEASVTRFATHSLTGRPTKEVFPSELPISSSVDASKVSEILGHLTSLATKTTYGALPSEFSMLSSEFGSSRASEILGQPTSQSHGVEVSQGLPRSEVSQLSSIFGLSKSTESQGQVTSKVEEIGTSTGLAAVVSQVTSSLSAFGGSRSSEIPGQRTSRIVQSGKPTIAASSSDLSRQSPAFGTSSASKIPGQSASHVTSPGQPSKGSLPSENSGLPSASASSGASSSSEILPSGRSALTAPNSNSLNPFSTPEPAKASPTLIQQSSQVGNVGKSTRLSQISESSKLKSEIEQPSPFSLIGKVTANVQSSGKEIPLSEPSGFPISTSTFGQSKAPTISGRYPTSLEVPELSSISHQVGFKTTNFRVPILTTSLPQSQLPEDSSISAGVRGSSVQGQLSASRSAGGPNFLSLSGRLSSDLNAPTSLPSKASSSLSESVDTYSLLTAGRPKYSQTLKPVSSEAGSETNLPGVLSKQSTVAEQVSTALPTRELSSGAASTGISVTEGSAATSAYSEATSGLAQETALPSVQSYPSSAHEQATYGNTHVLSGVDSSGRSQAESTSSFIHGSPMLSSSAGKATVSAPAMPIGGPQIPSNSKLLSSETKKSGVSTLIRTSNADVPSRAPESSFTETISTPKPTGFFSRVSSIMYGLPSSIPSNLPNTSQSLKASVGMLSFGVSSPAFPENPTKSRQPSPLESTVLAQSLESGTRSVGKPSEASVYTNIAESVLSTISGTDNPKVLPTAFSKSVASSLMQTRASEITSRKPNDAPSSSESHGMSEIRASTVQSYASSGTQGKTQGKSASISPSLSFPLAQESSYSTRLVASSSSDTTDDLTAQTTQKPSGMTSTQVGPSGNSLVNQLSRGTSLPSDTFSTGLTNSPASPPKTEISFVNPTAYPTRGSELLFSSVISSRIRISGASEISKSPGSRIQPTSLVSSSFDDRSVMSREQTESSRFSKSTSVSLGAKFTYYSAPQSETKSSTPFGEQLKSTISSLSRSLGTPVDTLGSAGKTTPSDTTLSRPEQSSASPETVKSFQTSSGSSRFQQSGVNGASLVSHQVSNSLVSSTERSGMSNTARGSLGSAAVATTPSGFQSASQKGSTATPAGGSASKSGRYDSATPSLSKATGLPTERTLSVLQSSFKDGEHVSETSAFSQATLMPTASQADASDSLLAPSFAQSLSERLPGLSSIISSLRAQTTSLIGESMVLNSMGSPTSVTAQSEPRSSRGASLSESHASVLPSELSIIDPQESVSSPRPLTSGRPTISGSAVLTSQLPPPSTSKASVGASQGPVSGTTQLRPTIAKSDSSEFGRPSSLISSEQSMSIKIEKTEIKSAATSMLAKDSPTAVNSYTELLQTLKSVTTTVSLSPKQSSMLSVARNSMSSVTQVSSFPSGSSSPMSKISTALPQEMSRVLSSVNSGAVPSSSESGYTSEGLTKMSPFPLPSDSHSEYGQSGAMRSPQGSTSHAATYSSSSLSQQTSGASRSTPALQTPQRMTPAPTQHVGTQLSELTSAPSSPLMTSSMNYISAELSSMSSASRSASLTSEVSRLSSLASRQSQLSLSLATPSQEYLAPSSGSRLTRSEEITLSSSSAQSDLFATLIAPSDSTASSLSSNIATDSDAIPGTLTAPKASKVSASAKASGLPANLFSLSQTGEATEISSAGHNSMPSAVSTSDTVKQLFSVSPQILAISTTTRTTSAVISQETPFTNSFSETSPIESGASATQSFTGHSSAVLSVGPYFTDATSSRKLRTGDSFTAPAHSQTSSPAKSDAQSSLDRFLSSAPTSSNVLAGTFSSSAREGSSDSRTRLEASITGTRQLYPSHQVLSTQAQSPQSKQGESPESSTSQAQVTSETGSYTGYMSDNQGTFMLPYSLPVVHSSRSNLGSPTSKPGLVPTTETSAVDTVASQKSMRSYQSVTNSNEYSSTEQVSATSTRTQAIVSVEAASTTPFPHGTSSLSYQPSLSTEAIARSSQYSSPSLNSQYSGSMPTGASNTADSSSTGSRDTILTNYISSTNDAPVKPTWISASQKTGSITSKGSVEMGSVRPNTDFSQTSLMDLISPTSESYQQSLTRGSQDMASPSSVFQVSPSFTRPESNVLPTSTGQNVPMLSQRPSSATDLRRGGESTYAGASFTSLGSITPSTRTSTGLESSISTWSQSHLSSAFMTEPSLSEVPRVSVQQTSTVSENKSRYIITTQSYMYETSSPLSSSESLGPQDTLVTLPSTIQKASPSIQTNSLAQLESQSKVSTPSGLSPPQASFSIVESNSAIPITSSSIFSEMSMSPSSGNTMTSMTSPTSKRTPSAVLQPEITASISQPASLVSSISVSSQYASRIVTDSQSAEITTTQTSSLALSLENQQPSGTIGRPYAPSISMEASSMGSTSYISTATPGEISSSPSDSRGASSSTSSPSSPSANISTFSSQSLSTLETAIESASISVPDYMPTTFISVTASVETPYTLMGSENGRTSPEISKTSSARAITTSANDQMPSETTNINTSISTIASSAVLQNDERWSSESLPESFSQASTPASTDGGTPATSSQPSASQAKSSGTQSLEGKTSGSAKPSTIESQGTPTPQSIPETTRVMIESLSSLQIHPVSTFNTGTFTATTELTVSSTEGSLLSQGFQSVSRLPLTESFSGPKPTTSVSETPLSVQNIQSSLDSEETRPAKLTSVIGSSTPLETASESQSIPSQASGSSKTLASESTREIPPLSVAFDTSTSKVQSFSDSLTSAARAPQTMSKVTYGSHSAYSVASTSNTPTHGTAYLSHGGSSLGEIPPRPSMDQRSPTQEVVSQPSTPGGSPYTASGTRGVQTSGLSQSYKYSVSYSESDAYQATQSSIASDVPEVSVTASRTVTKLPGSSKASETPASLGPLSTATNGILSSSTPPSPASRTPSDHDSMPIESTTPTKVRSMPDGQLTSASSWSSSYLGILSGSFEYSTSSEDQPEFQSTSYEAQSRTVNSNAIRLSSPTPVPISKTVITSLVSTDINGSPIVKPTLITAPMAGTQSELESTPGRSVESRYTSSSVSMFTTLASPVSKPSSSLTDSKMTTLDVSVTSSEFLLTSGSDTALNMKTSSRLPPASSTEVALSENSMPGSVLTDSQIISGILTVSNAASVSASTSTSMGPLTHSNMTSFSPISDFRVPTGSLPQTTNNVQSLSKTAFFSFLNIMMPTLSVSGSEAVPSEGSSAAEDLGVSTLVTPVVTSREIPSASSTSSVGLEPTGITNNLKPSQTSFSLEQDKSAAILTTEIVAPQPSSMTGFQEASQQSSSREGPAMTSVQSGNMPSTSSKTAAVSHPVQETLVSQSLLPTKPSDESPIGSVSTSLGSQLPRSPIYTTDRQLSQVVRPTSSSQTNEFLNPGTLQKLGSTETIFTLQTSSLASPESERSKTATPQPTSSQGIGQPMSTEEAQESNVNTLPRKSSLNNEISATSEMFTAGSLTMTPPAGMSSIKNPMDEPSPTQRFPTSEAADSTVMTTAPTNFSPDRPQNTGLVVTATGLETRPESATTAVWTTMIETVSSYTTYCPAPTTVVQGDKTYTVTEATTLTITECPCTHTKTFQESVTSTTVTDGAEKPAATQVPVEAPGDRSKAPHSLPVQSNPSNVSVVFSYETLLPNSRHRLAAADSTDTSFLDFGTSPPADAGLGSPASATQTDVSSSPALKPEPPLGTEEAANSNGRESTTSSNEQLSSGQASQGSGGHETTTPSNGRSSQSHPSHAGYDKDPTSLGTARSGGDQSGAKQPGQDPQTSSNGLSGSRQPTALPNNQPSQDDLSQGPTSSSDGQLGSPNQPSLSPDDGKSRESSSAINSNGSGSSSHSKDRPPESSEVSNGSAPESTGRETGRLPESDEVASRPNKKPNQHPPDLNETDKQEKSGSDVASSTDPAENQEGQSRERPSSPGSNVQHPEHKQGPGSQPMEPPTQFDNQNNAPEDPSNQLHEAQNDQDRNLPGSGDKGVQNEENYSANQGGAGQQPSQAVDEGVNQGFSADQQPGQQAPKANTSPEQRRPATQSSHDGLTFAPIISDVFNFYDGAMFDPAGNSMTSGADRMAQAREINANLPSEIQKAFNDNSIDYYYPGSGDFYYKKMCSDTNCLIAQAAKSCDCYVSGSDQGLRYLTSSGDGNLEKSTFNSQTSLPPATKHSVNSGDTLFAIAQRYGVDLSMILAANKDITNPDMILVGQVIQIPAQAYKIVEGDYLGAIAKTYSISLPALRALNGQIENPDLIFPGQVIKVPPKRLGDPFSTTVEPGDSLSSIANKWDITLESVKLLNPEIEDKNLIFPNQVVKVPMYMPVQGNLTTTSFCPTCEADEKAATLTGAKFARALTAPKIVATTIEVGPTATPIVAKVPAVACSQVSVENKSWLGKASRQLFRLI